MSVKGEIKITDSGTATLRNIKKETENLRNSVKSTRDALKSTFDTTYKAKIDTTGATSKIDNLKNSVLNKAQAMKSKLSAFGNMVVSPIVKIKDLGLSKIKTINSKLLSIGKRVISPVVKIADSASSKIKSIKSKLQDLGNKVPKPLITIKDKATTVLSSIAGKIQSLAKKMVIPVTVAATVASATLGASIKSGMQLEQQQISMKHFIATTNKDMDTSQVDAAAEAFTSALRENANATPFETGEVIQAGSRAIAVTQGNTTEAMNLVKLAEDMAAASGGTQDVASAMEALAGAKVGETERLKAFGFKVTAEELNAKGFEGITSDLNDFFGGASEKLAVSGSGLLSTITGKLKSSFADMGLKIVDQLKPVFTDIIGWIDTAMPYFDAFGTVVAQGIGSGIDFIKDIMPDVIDAVQGVLPPIMDFAQTFGENLSNIGAAVAPVIGTIISTVQKILPVVEPIISKIHTFVSNMVISAMPLLQSAIKLIGDAVLWLAPIVSGAVDTISAVITNLVDGIVGIISGGMDLISSIWSGDWSGVVSAFGDIFGGIGEICKAPINAVIGIINGAIAGINSLSVDIPDWVPMVGGQHWGMDLGEIPYLARGGVVNKATTAVFGEAGKEAVVPLENNIGWMDPVAKRMLNMLKGQQSINSVVDGSNIVYNININIENLDIDPEDKEDCDKLGKHIAEKIIEALNNR